MVVAAAAFLALGWWQWGRFESTAGSARNLGYALQWPLFAVAAVWGYRRFVQLEDEAELQDRLVAEAEGGADTATEDPSPAERPVAAPRSMVAPAGTLTAIPEGFLPSRATAPSAPDAAPDDPAHDEYNKLLAELAGSEQTEETK